MHYYYPMMMCFLLCTLIVGNANARQHHQQHHQHQQQPQHPNDDLRTKREKVNRRTPITVNTLLRDYWGESRRNRGESRGYRKSEEELEEEAVREILSEGRGNRESQGKRDQWSSTRHIGQKYDPYGQSEKEDEEEIVREILFASRRYRERRGDNVYGLDEL